MNTFVEIQNVSLNLPIYDISSRSFKKKIFGVGANKRIDKSQKVIQIKVLDNLNVKFESGDRIGLIGSNGAGKSSLLRLMAGIYKPTYGRVISSGSIVPLLDIGFGMDDFSTGRQNIRLRALLLGMTHKEILHKESEISSFCELGDHLDLPLKTYSAGMRLRLAFAISTSVNANILLLDEVLGVGDINFQQKANQRLKNLQERAEIVVMAMHSNDFIRENCNKALWLEAGKLRMYGDAEEVVRGYESIKQDNN